MSNYSKTVNFAAKDALVSGVAGKIVSGTEIDTEFNNIQASVATKAESVNGTHTGTTTVGALTDGTATLTGGVLTGSLAGNVTGNVTGNTSGTSATVTTAAQPTITSVGTLTSFTSTGIDDNATSTALTIDSSENATFAGDITVDGGTMYLNEVANSLSGFIMNSATFDGGINMGISSDSGYISSFNKNVTPSSSNLIFRTDDSSSNTQTSLTLIGADNSATFAGTITSGAVNSNVKLNTMVIDIGVWNMNTTANKTVSHSITLTKIRTVKATIRNDANSRYTDFSSISTGVSGGTNEVAVITGSIFLNRQNSGPFATGSYVTAPSSNRGWVTIEYVD